MKLTFSSFAIAAILLLSGCTGEQATKPTSDGSTSKAPASVAPETSGSATESVAETKPADETSATAMDLPEGAISIGSKAPALDIEHWISNGQGEFDTVTQFVDGKVYVVEFWATWCPPCVQSMPHLAELQQKFQDSVQVISVSDEDLETVNGFLERDLRGAEEEGPQTYGELTTVYSLTTDPDRSVSKAYMEAAGQNGIPACFVVGKTGVVEWIGHPMALDKPLSQVVDGTWNRGDFAETFKKGQMFDLIMSQIFAAAKSGDVDKANKLVAQARAVADPRQLDHLQSIETQIKMIPISEMAQGGDIAGAISEMQKLIESVDGPMKAQLEGVLEQLEQALSDAGEAAEAEAEVTDPLPAAE